MLPAVFILMLLLASPKGAEFESSLGHKMVFVQPKPYVTRIGFSWSYPTSGYTPNGFVLEYGSSPGAYTNAITLGRTNSYTFIRTNWNERAVRHFFAVQARFGSDLSAPSSEVHVPLYPNDHYRLTWTESGAVALFTAFRLPPQWQPLATVTGTNEFTGPLAESGAQFFGSPNAKLSITLFNPLN